MVEAIVAIHLKFNVLWTILATKCIKLRGCFIKIVELGNHPRIWNKKKKDVSYLGIECEICSANNQFFEFSQLVMCDCRTWWNSFSCSFMLDVGNAPLQQKDYVKVYILFLTYSFSFYRLNCPLKREFLSNQIYLL